jgi:UDP-N-acetylmuramoyl-L-alanyl-D-glutamate--2,6-diaminopimelate ligase
MLSLLRKLVPGFVVSWYHFLWAVLGALLYGFPARRMTVIGVTGTNGKSTTVEMISRIFLEAGFKTASLSSIRFQINEKQWRNTLKMTMPGRFVIQQFLQKAAKEGCTHAVVEVTSEGILQHRHRFLNFHTAVFTNLSPEHIERHGSFEKYKQTKGKLFVAAKEVHVINADDEHAPHFFQFLAKEKYFYSTDSSKSLLLRSSVLYAQNIEETEKGVMFSVPNMTVQLRLFGAFNVSNALAAISCAAAHGVSLETCKRALEKMEGVPGRMEEVIKQPFRVVVDYAFTPAALEKVYKTLKTTLRQNSGQANYKLICVLGATGGGRDKWKRPVLGKLAATYCDRVIITNEDPYEEDSLVIMQQVAQGADEKAEIFQDRREAIAKALSLATPGDVVVITGKGSEDSIAVKGGNKFPWDDREVVREEMVKSTEL